jgi:transcriptional regulator GlxA family with amidase domain
MRVQRAKRLLDATRTSIGRGAIEAGFRSLRRCTAVVVEV